jgi:hypothetical protein
MMWTGRGCALSALGAALLAAALAGCAGLGKDDKPDPNTYPANYKKDLVADAQQNPANFLNLRNASISEPMLKPFGSESRYVACLHAEGPDWRKDKLIIFFGGQINQYIDATGDQCAGVAYQPFPELVAALSAYGKKK